MEALFVNVVLDMLPFAAVVFAGLGVYLLRKEARFQDAVLSHLLFAGALYALGYFLEVNTSDLPTVLLIRNVYAIAMVLIPVLGMRFLSAMTRRRLPQPMLLTLSVLSVGLWGLFITNPLHHWFYRDITLMSGVHARFSVIVTERGPAYFVLVMLYVFFIAYADIVLVRAYRKETSQTRRANLTILFWSLQTIWPAFVFVLLEFDEVLDPVPLVLIVITALLAFQEIRTDLFEYEVRRWLLMAEAVRSPALLLDSRRSLRASNSAAAELLRMDLSRFLPLLDAYADSQETLELQSEGDVERHWYRVVRQILNLRRQYTSYMLTDVTAKKNAEDAEALELRMALLRAQIRPHFLYNALDAVANVCETDGMKGAGLILDLAAYLRKSLEYNELAQTDTLERELEYVATYFRIEQARYGERIHLEVENGCPLNTHLPALVLQPLVENAVRHGISRKPQGGTVKVSLAQEPNGMRVRVEDDGLGMEAPWTRTPRSDSGRTRGQTRSSVGLSNLDRRLRHLYRKGLDIRSVPGQGTSVEFFVPTAEFLLRPGPSEDAT